MTSEHKPPIVRITQVVEHASFGGRGKKFRIDSQRWTVYGVDAEGVERVYLEHTTKEEYKAWLATDPLWREAQRAVVDRFLADPQTRDTMIRLAIGAALDKGDMETVAKLVPHLPPEVRDRLTASEAVDGDQAAPRQ